MRVLPRRLHLAPQTRMMCLKHVFFRWSAIQLGVKVETTLPRFLLRLDLQWMRFGIGVLAYTADLPRDFRSRCSSGDLEMVIRDFLRDVKAGTRRSDRRQLIPEIAVDGLEPIGHLHIGLAPGIEPDIAGVDIEHL